MWTKFSHESLMLSFVELLAFDPVYGIQKKFLCHIGTTSALSPPYIEHENPINCKTVHSNVFVPPYRFVAS